MSKRPGIQKNYLGHRYVQGVGATQYFITSPGSIDDHLQQLAKQKKKPGHPDWDALLDAKMELEAEHASSEH